MSVAQEYSSFTSAPGAGNAPSRKGRPSLAVIGGGLAGIAAAESAARKGWDVELFEWSRVLGGRVASLFDPNSRRWIDNGQHALLGCCSELIALHRRLGLEDLFEPIDTISFTAAGNKQWNLGASAFLPPRWQLVPAFLKNPFLSFKDRLTTGLMLRKLVKLRENLPPSFPDAPETNGSGEPSGNGSQWNGDSRTFGDWLRKEGASRESIERFWNPLVYSALSDTVDEVCLFAAKKVVKDGFMSGKESMSLFVPKCPLRDIYHFETQRKLEALGVKIHFLSRVQRLQWGICEDPGENREEEDSWEARVGSLVLADGTKREFDRYILAIPAYRAWKLLEESDMSDYTDSLGFDRFELGSITAIHLWLDRPILPETQKRTALLDGPGQWLFRGESTPFAQGSDSWNSFPGFYHQVIISGSHRILSDEELSCKGSEKLVQRILEQLRDLFPQFFNGGDSARLISARTTTVFDAVFSPTPDVYRFRPLSQTPLNNFALAGDWTQTDWPATMEGAVRSGRLAVETLESEKLRGEKD